MTAKRMTTAQKIKALQQVRLTGTLTPADEGFAAAERDNQEMHDEENPQFLFSTTWTSLLTKIAKGEIDAMDLAKRELANRGLNNKGEWVGFKAAEQNTNWHYNNSLGGWTYIPDRE